MAARRQIGPSSSDHSAMTIGDILIGLIVLFCLFVGICALLLCVVGFSFGQDSWCYLVLRVDGLQER